MAGTRTTAGVQRFRSRKINLKQTLLVIREEDLDADEYKDSLKEGEPIETGVEKNEESEYHLQEALRGNSEHARNIVPPPPPKVRSDEEYNKLYGAAFKKPTPYIAFSETVEHTIGCLYDMNSDDDVWLQGYNTKRGPNAQKCDEDVFERYMEYFERVADFETPFAAVDQTIVSFQDMELHIKTEIPHFESVSVFFKDIYEYWRTRRQCSSNRSLQPSLKFEVVQEVDDSDPYVCFRRRDVKIPRKTRGRDQNAQDKLKKLRMELEDGRLLVLNWEQSLKDQQRATRHNRKIFQKRAEIRDLRLRLQLNHNDEDLVNQKPQRKRPVDLSTARTQQPMRQAQPMVRTIDDNLITIEDHHAALEEARQKTIADSLEQYGQSNKLYMDWTSQVVSDHLPPVDNRYRVVHTQMPISPPASSGGDVHESAVTDTVNTPTAPHTPRTPGASEGTSVGSKRDFASAFEVSNAAVMQYGQEEYQHQYRRRIGRGGRLWIDRKGLKPPQRVTITAHEADKWKYDQDSDDDEQVSIYEADPYSTEQLNFRANIKLVRQPT